VATPGKTVPNTKAGDRSGVLLARSKDGYQSVAPGAQDSVYVLDKRSLVPIRMTKLAHRLMPEACLADR
jgi:hypothetical protein